MSLLTDYQLFESMLSNGLELQAHSGSSGPDNVTVYTVQEFYDHDEIMCEEEFANGYSSSDISIESILNGEINLDTHELGECLNSYINGNFEQFKDQFEELEDQDVFFDHISLVMSDKDIINIQRKIINFIY